MELFTDLHEQAVKVGGAVISLLGNHEINNSMGILTYVSAKGLDGFKKYAPLPAEDEFCLLHPKTIERQEKQNEFYNTL